MSVRTRAIPADIGIGDQLSDEGKITSNKYEIGKTGITKVLDVGNLYIKRCDLDTFIAASGRDISTVPVSSNNLAATIELGSSTLSKKERETLLKLVIGMAVKGYSYDPAASKNSATKEIVDDLADLGIGIDPDTVRKYLKEAERTVLPTKPRQS